jgi:hypothetical protein
MQIFRPEFPCRNGNLAAKFGKIPARIRTPNPMIGSDRPNHLTAVTIEDMDNFYLIPNHL